MRKNLLIIGESIIIGILVFQFTVANAFSSLDYMARDQLYQIPRGIRSDIKIIGIDAKTLDKYGPVQTWSRSLYADLINKLNVDENTKPYVIAIDITFSGNNDDGDHLLAEAAADHGNVVVVSNLLYSKKAETDQDGILYYPVEGIVLPYEELMNNTYIGFSNVAQDSDGTVRRLIPTEYYDGSEYSMFSKVIYERYCAATGMTPHIIPTDFTGRSIINYSGRPGDYECLSMADVLEDRKSVV